MRFDEKPKKRSFSLKKSRAKLTRESSPSRPKKSAINHKKTSTLSKSSSSAKVQKDSFTPHHKDSFSPHPASRLRYSEDDVIPAVREKPEKFPEGYNENETFFESLKSFLGNHKPVVAIVIIAVIVAAGTFTGAFSRLFSQNKDEATVSATEEESFLVKPKTVFTQGKFNLNVENTDAGVDIICETTTDEQGNEQKTCRAKTEEDKKREQEEKEREEQEKKAKEEREKEEQEDKAAEAAKKAEQAAAAKTDNADSSKKEQPVSATGITNISNCPAEAVSGSTVILKAMVLPYNAENQNIIWSSRGAAKVVYEGAGNTATVTIEEGEKAIITAMSVDGGFSAHCYIPVVEQLTE